MPNRIRYRTALNPIQWIATPDGWIDPALAPPLDELLAQIAGTGFTAVHAQPPAGVSTADYATALAAHGLHPAPGYLSLGLPEHGVERPQALDAARRAATQQAELGLSDMFLSTRMQKGSPRVLRPGVGAAFDEARFAMLLDLIQRAAEVIRAEGVMPALHPHIGTWIETETETRRILDAIPASELGFGPDTGHLSWAGADVMALLRDYRDRIRVAHVKDCRLSLCRDAVARGLSYQDTVLSGIWAEPGSGELDLAGMIAALGPDFDGWLIAEVDYSTLPPLDSARACQAWFSALAGRA